MADSTATTTTAAAAAAAAPVAGTAGAPAGAQPSITCRMYANKFPDVDDLVMVRVKSIADMGAYVSLLEYNNIEGMILLSELSRRRIRSVTKLVRVGRQEVCVVLRVDKEKGYIDLSKRRVSPEDVTRLEEKFNNSKCVHSIMMHVAKTQHLDVEKLYTEFGWPMYKKFGHAIEGFKRALTDPDAVFVGTDYPPELRESFVKNIKRRLAPQPVKIRADLEVTCFSYEGIDAIKAALSAGQDVTPADSEHQIKITLVAPPLYVMMYQSLDKTQGIELLTTAIAAVTTVITAANGNITVKAAPRAVSEREDRELSTYMEELERQNAEVSGDDEPETDEERGSGASESDEPDSSDEDSDN